MTGSRAERPGELDERPCAPSVGARLRGLLRRRAPRPAILVIDDEPSVREFLRAALEPEGYAVYAASSGAEALQLWERARKAIRLVITDVVMPGMDGPETVLQLAARGAGVPVLYISAYPRERIPHQDRYTAYLHKPFMIPELMDQVHDLLKTAS